MPECPGFRDRFSDVGSPYKLPGTRFAVQTRGELPRAAAAASVALGTLPSVMRLASAWSSPLERLWAKAVIRLLKIDLRISGLEHVDVTEQYVVAPLYERFADVVALLHLPLDLKFVARTELSDWRILGSHLDRSAHIVVDPESPSGAYRRMLRSAPEVFSSEASIVVFPQGTILGIKAAFTAGAFRLADRYSRPLLPVVLSGSHRVWEHPFSPLVSFGRRIDMQVLQPLAPGCAVAAISDLERQMKAAALASHAKPRRFVPERDRWWDGHRYEIDPAFGELATRLNRHRAARSLVSALATERGT